MALEKIEIDKKLLEYSLSQFRNVPEYVAICDAIAKGMSTIQDGVDYLSNMIDIDKAEGVWLDYIGALVGEYRSEYIDTDKYFCVNAEDVNESKFFYFPNNSIDGSGTTLSDDLFRGQIKAKIAYNNSKGTREDNIQIFKNYTNAIKVVISKYAPMLLDVTLYPYNNNFVNSPNLREQLEQFLSNGVGINDLNIFYLRWTEKSQIDKNILKIISDENKVFVLTLDGNITFSSDLENWNEFIPISSENKNWHDFTKNENTIIVIARNNGEPNIVVSQDNGITWGEPFKIDKHNLDGSITYVSWLKIIYGERFVAISSNQNYITTTIDGETWTEPQMPNIINDTRKKYSNLDLKGDYFLEDIIYNFIDKKYVLLYKVRNYGTRNGYNFVATSIDGINWQNPILISEDFTDFQSITYGNNMYIISSLKGLYMYSYDGEIWTTNNITSSSFWSDSIKFINNIFLNIDNYNFIYSFNGIDWLSLKSDFSLEKDAIGFKNNIITFNRNNLYLGKFDN